MAKTLVIEAQELFRDYELSKGNVIQVIRGVSFSVYSGEFILLHGPSGCGKSTILNILAGLETLTKGKVKVRGEDISQLSPEEMAEYRRSKVGIVFQQFNLLRSLTNLDNVALPLLAGGEVLHKARNRAANLLNMMGLGKHINKLPPELSGGQQQRVALARAMAKNPWIILADEPTGNLDSKSSDEVMNIFVTLSRKSKRTIVMVTHNPDYLKYATRILYIRDGKIIKERTNKRLAGPRAVEGFDVKRLAISAAQ